MKIFEAPKKESWASLLKRPAHQKANLESAVNEVFRDVKLRGDAAIKDFTHKFDAVTLESFSCTPNEVKQAEMEVSKELKNAIDIAHQNIYQFHNNQVFSEKPVETMPGVNCWRKSSPIEKVGLYIPGGTAPLFSTVLMLGIPAKIAGCSEIVLCTPPDKNGKIPAAILYAASKVGIDKIFKVGGIQAIAALTYGTETIPSVYKIFGPGNQFVTAAKEKATIEGIAIDMPAGPSEVLVLADKSAKASFIASDLLSQAEHGIDSQSILVTTCKNKLHEVAKEVSEQLKQLPRKEIAKQSIANSILLYMPSIPEAMELINDYGPEHFIIMCEAENEVLSHIKNAGSVFIGDYTPESAGDYASGTNHTLPTNGFSKAYSGVSLDSFCKRITFQKITKEGLQLIGPSIEIMAENEDLMAHKNAVSIRLNSKP